MQKSCLPGSDALRESDSRGDANDSDGASANSSPAKARKPTQTEDPAPASQDLCKPLPDFTFKQLLNVMLQCTFLYVESDMGLVQLDVFQVNVA